MENTYGEEASKLITQGINHYYNSPYDWTNTEKASLFENAAYEVQETEPLKAIEFANIAERSNKKLDLSLLVARIYVNLGNTKKAKEILDIGLYYESEPWELNQKGNILIELKEYKKAFKIFERVETMDSTMVNTNQLYKILISDNETEKARAYLVADTLQTWGKASSLQKLLNHDISYSSAQVALESYKRMQEEDYYDDFLGVKQLRIFLKNPLQGLSWIGITHMYMLLLAFVILFLLPFIWVLPVYSANKYFHWTYKGKPLWNLKHFWLVSFAYLAVQLVVVLLFYYQDFINSYFSIGTEVYYETESELTNPNEIIFFAFAMLVAALVFLNKKRVQFLIRSKWSFPKIIGASFLFYLFNLFFLKLYGSVVDVSEGTVFMELASMKEEITLMLNEKGIWLTIFIVGILAPFYEEIIFRGIILKSTSKYIGHARANILQSVLFAVVHFSFVLFPFYLLFGLITGYVSKKTDGLVAPMVFHAMNNTFVVLLLYIISRYTTSLY
ncbi:MAG: hypothetical protein CMC70_11460 [Flavobacteriaceae bacterium]|nr:hypothetical protein [Flavobacteriaceae bacterium]